MDGIFVKKIFKVIRVTLIICLVLIINSTYGQEEDSLSFTKYRFGGYGEILYKYMDYGANRYTNPDGAPADERATIGLPRAIFSFDYKFNHGFQLSTELEIEHGGTGSALELEYEEFGEYELEVEKAGEVVLEQFYIQKSFSNALKFRAGHIIVPLGRLNAYHLPTEFFGTVRPEGEDQIIPATWHETGIAVLGTLGDWSYEAQLVNGLDANGFSRANWVKGGYQRLFEDIKATQMAFVWRIDNRSIPNTRLSVSMYRGNSAKNTTKPEKMEGIDGTVSIYSSDAEFNNRRIIARVNMVYGHLKDAFEIGKVNQTLSKYIQYPRTPVAQNALTWSVEIGYDLFTHFRSTGKLIPFARYEYYDPMERTTGGVLADARFKREVYTFGVNYYLLDGLALKVDYAMRIIDGGNYNQENTLGVALVYSTYFVKK